VPRISSAVGDIGAVISRGVLPREHGDPDRVVASAGVGGARLGECEGEEAEGI
jgi:hypothetical protein